MANKEDILKSAQQLESFTPQQVIAWGVETFGLANIALATSFGAEDQVLTDLLAGIDPKIGIFTLDTGRLPQETYDVMDQTRSRYGIKIQALFPEQAAVEAMLAANGPNQFTRSVELRKSCCHVRKVAPLQKKLSTLKAWICGLRRGQAVTRGTVAKLEWDEANGLFKFNPLADWSESQVWDHIKAKDVPYNRLHDQGYPSIGCAPCTRAIKPGEDVRAGRWWWENPEHKECGLHTRRKG